MTDDLISNNLLLKSLPQPVFDDIKKCVEVVHFDLRDKVELPNQPIQFVYFPHTAIISILRPLEGQPDSDQATVEIATIGNEGIVGASLALGVAEVAELAFCQVEGSAWRLSSADFIRLLQTHPELPIICHRYIATFINLSAGNAACNRNHSIEERCARWLLLTHDRCGRQKFMLTQEFLGKMLGASRSGVNLAAGMLSRAQLISYVRGKIDILDRRGLEEVSCACYSDIRRYYEKTIGTYY